MFRRNVGGLDRTLRIVVGLVLLPTGLFLLAGKHSYAVAITVIGLIALATGLFGFCGLYLPFRFSTAREDAQVAAGGKQTASHP